jgi:hypothetical protein
MWIKHCEDQLVIILVTSDLEKREDVFAFDKGSTFDLTFEIVDDIIVIG